MFARHDQADRDALAAALAGAVAADLNEGLSEKGRASLAVSGGSTPAKFFAALSEHAEVDWANVTVTLVDERWVHEDSDRSNARLVRTRLLQNAAASARFVPLFGGGDEPEADGLARAAQLQAGVPHPFDAVIFGMGNDGHTASFFPGGDELQTALTSPGPLCAIRAPGAGEPRVTLTLPYLLATRSVYLHIEGGEKAETLDKALADGPAEDMPVRALLRQDQKTVNIYWSP